MKMRIAEKVLKRGTCRAVTWRRARRRWGEHRGPHPIMRRVIMSFFEMTRSARRGSVSMVKLARSFKGLGSGA